MLENLSKQKVLSTLHNLIEPHTKGVFRDNHWKPISAITSALDKHGIDFQLQSANYYHNDKGDPAGKTWTYHIPVNDQGGVILVVTASFGPSPVSDPTSAYDVIYQIEWTAKLKKSASVLDSIKGLEIRLASNFKPEEISRLSRSWERKGNYWVSSPLGFYWFEIRLEKPGENFIVSAWDNGKKKSEYKTTNFKDALTAADGYADSEINEQELRDNE